MLLKIKGICLEEYSSWEEEKSAHLDQEQFQDGNWDHVEQLRSNDVKTLKSYNQLQYDAMTWNSNQ